MSTLKWEALGSFYDRANSMPEMTWLIDGLVPESGRVALIAAPNSGKTWAALVIGRTAAQRGRDVLFVLEEGGVKPTAERFKALGFSAKDRVQLLHLSGVRLNDASTLTFLLDTVRSKVAPVLVLDPLSSIFDGDENSTEEMNAFKANLEQLVRANPAALLVILHHTSKGGEREGASKVHAGRGSSIMAGWVDVQLNLAHVETPTASGVVAFDVVVAKMRDGERGQKKTVTICLGEEEPVSIETSVTPPDEGVRERIRKAVATSIEPMTRNGIFAAVGGRRNVVLAAVTAMVDEGLLVPAGKGLVLTSKTEVNA